MSPHGSRPYALCKVRTNAASSYLKPPRNQQRNIHGKIERYACCKASLHRLRYNPLFEFTDHPEEIHLPTALITGVTGQDGSYLAEFLLAKGYRVVGMVRRSGTGAFERIKHIQDDIAGEQGDLHDKSSL